MLRPAGIRAGVPARSPIAQLVEHSTVNRMVAGSSPARGANNFSDLDEKLADQPGPAPAGRTTFRTPSREFRFPGSRVLESPQSPSAPNETNEWIAAVPPFEIETLQVEIFDCTSVIYIGLGGGRERIKRIHDQLNAGLLAFAEPFPYHPHITLAQEIVPEQVARAREEAKKRWAEFKGPRTFAAETITFVQNTSDNRWVDLAHWTLGTVPTAG